MDGGHQGLREGGGELLFNGDRVSDLQGEKSYGDRWWRSLHNIINIFKTTELTVHLVMIKMVNFMLCVFCHNFKNWKIKKRDLSIESKL